jgi:hypothetical protein
VIGSGPSTPVPRDHEIPVLRLASPDRSRWDDRKLGQVRPHLEAAEREGRFGVAAVVVAEEFQRVWSAGPDRRNRESRSCRSSRREPLAQRVAPRGRLVLKRLPSPVPYAVTARLEYAEGWRTAGKA